MTKTYAQAIKAINENAQVQIVDNDYNQINWLDTTPIDKATLDAKITELEATETTAKETKATNRTNAIAKLKASTWSPLTDDEATALFGE